MKWCLVLLILQFAYASAQHRWDGEANNRLWSDTLNWEGDSLPNPGSQVIIDNFYIDSNYSILLDSSSGNVVISSIELIPAEGKYIRLIIPPQNKLSPAINCVGQNSIRLNNRAVFQNSSGAVSGSVILIGDSVYLFNGSRYIHNTSRAHASFVSLLSSRNGTESGVFEFDVPSASTTVSLSDRIFGSLVFSSGSAGGSSNYTASGTKPIKVRSNLELINGAKLNLNFNDTLQVSGDLKLTGSTINLSSSLRNLVVKIMGNLSGDESSNITESGSSFAEILLSGNLAQQVNIKGAVLNDVRMVINNSSGINLSSDLSVSSRIELKKGIVYTRHTALLKVGRKAYFVCDTLNIGSFVSGPVYMESDSIRSYTMIPVGAGGILRWVGLKNWSGSFLGEYIKEDPNLLGTVEDLDHISKQGYWKFSFWSGQADAVELSFPDANFSGVTDLGSLGGAAFYGNKWIAQLVKERKGAAGSNGAILLGPIDWQSSTMFTLGSYLPSQNPLPLRISERRKKVNEEIKIRIFRAYRSGSEMKVVIESKERGPFELVMANSLGQILVKRNINVMKGTQIISIRLPLHTPSIFHLFGLFWGMPVKPIRVFL